MFSLDVSLIRAALEGVPDGTLGEQFKNNDLSTIFMDDNDTYGLTPFVHACKHGASDVVDFFLGESRYIVTPSQITKGFIMACRRNETTLIKFFLRNCSVTLTPEQFGQACSLVSSEIFNELFPLITSTDYLVLDGFQRKIPFCDESNLVYLIQYGCTISEECYQKIVGYCHPDTIRLAATKVPDSSIAKTCSFLFERERDNRMPKYLPVEDFIPLYEEFFDYVATEDYDDMMYMFTICPSPIYNNIILRIIKSGKLSARYFGRDLKTICDITNSTILEEFLKCYPCERWNFNHYRGCIQYVLRVLQSRSEVNLEPYKEKLIIFAKSNEHLAPFKKFLRSLIPNDNQDIKDILIGVLF